jgi:type II secretory pathway pseudopilin PulG
MARHFSSSDGSIMQPNEEPPTASKNYRQLFLSAGVKERGFTYLGLLFLIAIMGVLAAVAGALWSIDQRRQKEKELLFVGNQFRKAIAGYYERSPGSVKQYPRVLEDLLTDNRFVVPMRHLRKVYRDPISLTQDWGIVRGPDGGISGVYSLSTAEPMKKGNFSEANSDFVGKGAYYDWRFVYRTPLPNLTK